MKNIKSNLDYEYDWILLFYMNGNNDLAPEIYNSFLELNKCYNINKIKIVVQISLASKQLVYLTRHNINYEIDMFFMNGRYTIEENKLTLLEILDKPNMASPETLFDFLLWSTNNFKAKKTALFLGGHGYENIGCMTDLTGIKPYIMKYEQIAYTLSCLNKTIDILMIDTCWNYKNNASVIDIFDCIWGESNSYVVFPNENQAIDGYSNKSIVEVFLAHSKSSVVDVLSALSKKLEYLFIHKISKSICINNYVDIIPLELNENELYACIKSVNPNLSEVMLLKILKRVLKYM